MCFFKVKTFFDITQEWLVWLMWNEKEVQQLDTGILFDLDLDLTHDLDLGFFKVKFFK